MQALGLLFGKEANMKKKILLASATVLAVANVWASGEEDVRTDFGPMAYAEIREYAVQPTVKNKNIPEALRITQAEADALNAKIKADADVIGYNPKRGPAYAGHYFGSWTKRYWDSNREYFGLTPSGERGVVVPGFPPWMKSLSKMCESNDEVVKLRIEKWIKEGKPECLKLGENDGYWGFCRCEGCKALDADITGEPFLAAKTDRYLNFWNRVTAKARELRSDVKVTVHLYSAYYYPPRREKVAFPDNMVFSLVTKFQDTDPVATVKGWKKAGMKHFFHRPNYHCNRSAFPIGREKFIWEIQRKMLGVGAMGVFYDATRGVPATEFEVYVAQRLCVDPNLPFSVIERDWTARFGAASEVAKAYYARVRERCDRRFSELIEKYRNERVVFIDDSHFSRDYHKFHSAGELKDDLALLEKFDCGLLQDEALENFKRLKVNARHYIIAKRAHDTMGDADKKALLDFRIANKPFLGTAWGAYWNKGEFWLWNDDPNKMRYEMSGSSKFVEEYENSKATSIPPIAFFVHPSDPACAHPDVPKELHFGKEQGKRHADEEMDEFTALGYEKRMPYRAGHSFTRWVKKFWDTKREYFGQLPNGQRGLTYPGLASYVPNLSKVCVSSEAVIDEKLAEWERAKCPELLIAGENDGDMGYCRCSECLKMDAPVEGEGFVVNKSDRYMAFWNRLAMKARKKRPDVKIGVFLYSATRRPPRKTRVAYPGNMIFSYVPTLHDDDPVADIQGWRKMGAKFFYNRPNYLCIRSAIPAGLEKYICDAHHKMQAIGSTGDCFDRSAGCKAQQFSDFAAVMLCVNPNATFEEIERKWCSRFGAASETVKEYYARVRERCDSRWPKLRKFLRDREIEFLDDSHFSRCVHKLHTLEELEADKAVLDRFDASVLDGTAKKRFQALKALAQQAVLVKRMFVDPSEGNKNAVSEFRKANKNSLGYGWLRIYTKGEFWVWNETPRKIFQENSAIKRYAERLEDSMKPGCTLIAEDDPESMRIHEALKSNTPLE